MGRGRWVPEIGRNWTDRSINNYGKWRTDNFKFAERSSKNYRHFLSVLIVTGGIEFNGRTTVQLKVLDWRQSDL